MEIYFIHGIMNTLQLQWIDGDEVYTGTYMLSVNHEH